MHERGVVVAGGQRHGGGDREAGGQGPSERCDELLQASLLGERRASGMFPQYAYRQARGLQACDMGCPWRVGWWAGRTAFGWIPLSSSEAMRDRGAGARET